MTMTPAMQRQERDRQELRAFRRKGFVTRSVGRGDDKIINGRRYFFQTLFSTRMPAEQLAEDLRIRGRGHYVRIIKTDVQGREYYEVWAAKR